MNNHERPLVSVVMPVYNAERFLRQAIDSVLNQTYQNVELIAVDDGSNDGSLRILNEYKAKDSRVYVIQQKQNQGVANARNRGIQLAKGKFIALLDSDDVWEMTKINRQVALLAQEDADIAYCSLDFIDENGVRIKKPFIVANKTDYNRMLIRCEFTCSTIMAKAELLKAHLFRSDYYHEDFCLWMELMKLPIKVVGDRTVLMHNRQSSQSRSNNKVTAAMHRWKIYREALGMSVYQSGIVFVKYAFWGVMKYYI